MWAAPPMLLVDLTQLSARESGQRWWVAMRNRGGGCDGRRVGGEGGDGTIVLGETDEWVCEARYHAKQHEKRRKTKLAK